jgi:chromosome segregation ATPase
MTRKKPLRKRRKRAPSLKSRIEALERKLNSAAFFIGADKKRIDELDDAIAALKRMLDSVQALASKNKEHIGDAESEIADLNHSVGWHQKMYNEWGVLKSQLDTLIHNSPAHYKDHHGNLIRVYTPPPMPQKVLP